MRRAREFPLEDWIFRSEYERKQAQRLLDNDVFFLYEHQTLDFLEGLSFGVCMDCGGKNVGKLRKYTPDFYIPATKIFIETKGKFDSRTRTKMKNVCSQCEEDIRMVFMANNWLTRKHKMTYGRWCKLNGIEYAIGNIPLEWCHN